MKKLISYSLWGNNSIYNHGFMQNYFGAKRIYPEWEVVLYYDDTIEDFVKDFIKDNNVLSFNMSGSNIAGAFWRFLANDIDGVSHVIFRDCDSRLSLREKLAVDEWVASDKVLHVMRDHPMHRIPLGTGEMGILAGMWGLKTGSVEMTKRLKEYFDLNTNPAWGSDQTFTLGIYKEYQNSIFTHDEFFGGNKFPIPRENKHFVGERINENNQRIGNDYLMIL
jgi:hypothetical protein